MVNNSFNFSVERMLAQHVFGDSHAFAEPAIASELNYTSHITATKF